MNNEPIRQHDNSIILKKIYEIYVSWHILSNKLPKKDKFSIGQKVSNLLLDMLTIGIASYHTGNILKKKELLLEMSSLLECIKIIIRLAKDVKAINMKQYVRFQMQLQEIGKMLGGWIKQAQSSSTRR